MWDGVLAEEKSETSHIILHPVTVSFLFEKKGADFQSCHQAHVFAGADASLIKLCCRLCAHRSLPTVWMGGQTAMKTTSMSPLLQRIWHRRWPEGLRVQQACPGTPAKGLPSSSCPRILMVPPPHCPSMSVLKFQVLCRFLLVLPTVAVTRS